LNRFSTVPSEVICFTTDSTPPVLSSVPCGVEMR
jgi:hypothetical protein